MNEHRTPSFSVTRIPTKFEFFPNKEKFLLHPQQSDTPAARKRLYDRTYNTQWHVKDVYRDVVAAEIKDKIDRRMASIPKRNLEKHINHQHSKMFYRDSTIYDSEESKQTWPISPLLSHN